MHHALSKGSRAITPCIVCRSTVSQGGKRQTTITPPMIHKPFDADLKNFLLSKHGQLIFLPSFLPSCLRPPARPSVAVSE